jgi:NAD(P)-dependent dehydrogenase (short-subunit alcohol dehydrogenase family)
MTTATETPATSSKPGLADQTVVVIGGSAGIGLEVARLAHAEGADVVIAGRNPDHLEDAAGEVGAARTAVVDATDTDSLAQFFAGLADPVNHVMVTAGRPSYGPLFEMASDELRQALTEHAMIALEVARHARGRVRPGGSMVFMGGTGGRRPRPGQVIAHTVTTLTPALIAGLALEVAPVRVNLIAAGFVDTGLSAELLGDDLDKRRDELRSTLPVGRVIGPADVAALAVQAMANTALTGATFDVDGGQQLIS